MSTYKSVALLVTVFVHGVPTCHSLGARFAYCTISAPNIPPTPTSYTLCTFISFDIKKDLPVFFNVYFSNFEKAFLTGFPGFDGFPGLISLVALRVLTSLIG